MANRHPFPTSSVAATFGVKTGGSHSSAHSGTASCFMPDTHISGREPAVTYLWHSTWTAIGLPSASFTNLDHTPWDVDRSEEHTSELQSLAYLVCRLLLEKKKIVHHDCVCC